MGQLAARLRESLQPAAGFELVSAVFLKGLALVYVAAFLSLAFQIEGLAGPQGILPLGEGLERLHALRGAAAWFEVPTLFWLDAGDSALKGASIAGALLAVALLLGLGPQRVVLALLFLLYLSLYHAGQVFTNFQWDYLLLEAGFLAIFLVPAPTPLTIFLYHWLLFRLRFLSGLSKLASGDPSWAGFTALQHYFETQPLPHAGAWWAHQLPEPLLRAGVGLTFFSELIVPFFIFLPRPFRLFAAAVTALMQLLIIATSNHNFFNLLTLLLCLFLLDDRALRRLLPPGLVSRLGGATRAAGGVVRAAMVAAAGLVVAVSLATMYPMVTGRGLPTAMESLAAIGPRYGIGNSYHVFPNMQTERQELTVAGSYDGSRWERYEFRYKPGALDQPSPFVVPHQPRLDWMMWFVPTQSQQVAGWFNGFIDALAANSAGVTALLAHNPFAGRPPPRYFQVLAYRYRYTTREERARSGDWWRAEYLGVFPDVPPRRP